MKIFHPCVQFFLFSDKIETLNFNFDGGFDGLARAQLRNVIRRRLGKYETGRVLNGESGFCIQLFSRLSDVVGAELNKPAYLEILIPDLRMIPGIVEMT